MLVNWDVFKTFINSNISVQSIDLDRSYWLKLFNGPFEIECNINKDTDECTDFETNFKSHCNKIIKSTVLTEPANISLTLYKAPDVVEVNAGSTVTIDLQLTQVSNEVQQIIYGGALYTDSPGFNDHVKFQIIDIDNVIGYGNNVVLKEYIEKAYLNNHNTFEDYDEAGAYLPVGIYLRCIYTSTKSSGTTKIKINYLLGVPE
jgi:hypothetical protein